MKTLAILRWIATRSVVFYVLIFLLSNVLVDYKQIEFGYKIRLLNKIMPISFEPVLKAMKKEGRLLSEEWAPFVQFYSRLIEFFPERADGLSMLGFCFYAQGDMVKALSYFKEAEAREADVFSFVYNQALIYYQARDYQNASSLLRQAIAKDLPSTLVFIDESKIIYRLIYETDPRFARACAERLRKAFDDSVFLLALIQYSFNAHQEVLALAQAAIDKNNFDADLLFYAGLSAYHIKDYILCARYMRLSLQSNPQNLQAWEKWEEVARLNGDEEVSIEASAKVAFIKGLADKELYQSARQIHKRIQSLDLFIF